MTRNIRFLFLFARDGRLLVAGGRSRFIHVWSLDTQRLTQIVELPNKVTSVKQLQFLSDNFDGGSSQVICRNKAYGSSDDSTIWGKSRFFQRLH